MMKVLFVVLLWAGLAGAQASRTWVSGVGDDANPCSRTAPCKTFAGAISKTAAGGEIDALDPAGYGALTITKAITLDGGGGQVASVLVSGTNGIVVQAGAADNVIIRNLRINGIAGSGNGGINGIRFLAGKSLTIENCDIFGFTTHGIDIASAGGKVFIDNTTVSNNNGNGVNVSSVALTFVSIDNSRFELNNFGVNASNFSQVVVRHSVANGNASVGFLGSAAAGTAELDIYDSMAGNNGSTGVQAGGGGASSTVRISNVASFGNPNGLLVGAGGSLKSFGNNFNSTTGAPTAPNLTPQ
ncbi:MAG TPA: right-handed parallel beta-helix repeat-containing protein [Terriglobales bacterium]|nr:right-handed parallel beta-helix repeat-containing protein [Terriglobales bacterium]